MSNATLGMLVAGCSGIVCFVVLWGARTFGSYTRQLRDTHESNERLMTELRAVPHVSFAITQIPQEKSA